jgi:hypothetical protein
LCKGNKEIEYNRKCNFMPKVTERQKKMGEKGKQEFLRKCFEATKKEGKPREQQIAQCLNMWKQGVKHKKSKGCQDCEPTWEELDGDGYYIELQ